MPNEIFRGRQAQSIEIAFGILEEVARSGPGVTAREVSEGLGLPRSTTYRVIRQLIEAEYLVRNPDLTGLALGHRLADLAKAGKEHQPDTTTERNQ